MTGGLGGVPVDDDDFDDDDELRPPPVVEVAWWQPVANASVAPSAIAHGVRRESKWERIARGTSPAAFEVEGGDAVDIMALRGQGSVALERPSYHSLVRTLLLGSVVLLLSTSSCIASTAPSGNGSEKEVAPIATFGAGHHGPSKDDAPEISRGLGEKGGFVILWPRITPKGDPALALEAPKLQHRLEALVRATFPDAPIDVRPEPERSCPRDGCVGTALGIMLFKRDKGCVLAVSTQKSGTSPALLNAWVGDVVIKGQVPFRDAPEPFVQINESRQMRDGRRRAHVERADRRRSGRHRGAEERKGMTYSIAVLSTENGRAIQMACHVKQNAILGWRAI